MSLSKPEKLARLRLWRTPRIGPATFRTLINKYGDAQKTIERLPDHVRALGKPAPKIPSQGQTIAEIERLHALNGRFIFMGNEDFPELLEQIDDAPPILAAVGKLELLKKPSVAIVGSRNASLNGKKIAQTFASELGRQGFAIVSGLAKGIDACAHQAALETGTIGVVAGGIDVIYPRENAPLYAQMRETGLILSEQPLGMPTSARLFPLRNRLVSGLCQGTLVVEANMRSGSLITARLANEQGREVFAVPGSPLEGRADGTNYLIQQGANLVTQPADLAQNLSAPKLTLFREPEAGNVQAGWVPISQEPLKDRILEILGPDPIAIDEVARECQVAASQMQLALADFEVSGLILRHPGGQISLTP